MRYPTLTEQRLPAIRTGSGWAWYWQFRWLDDATGVEMPIDLTGAEVRLVLRRRLTDEPFFTASPSALLLDVSSGKVAVEMASADTRGFPAGDAIFGLAIRLAGADWWEAIAGTVPVVAGAAR